MHTHENERQQEGQLGIGSGNAARATWIRAPKIRGREVLDLDAYEARGPRADRARTEFLAETLFKGRGRLYLSPEIAYTDGGGEYGCGEPCEQPWKFGGRSV